MLYFDHEKFWQDVLFEIQKTDTDMVLVSSYGLYAGISDTGVNTDQKYHFDSVLQKILNESLNVRKFVFLLSESEFFECTPNCPHCKEKQEKKENRSFAHARHWPKISWHMTVGHHLKAVIVVKKDKSLVAWTGGRNFTSSNWQDLSLRLNDEDAQELLRHITFLIKEKSVALQ